MGETDKISIVVPAYNVEKYIEKCIGSLLSQTHRNIEILLVLNGSTDQTAVLAKQMVSNDDRIKIFEIEQSGVSNARNVAIGHSTGKYMMFLDGDDFYDITMVEKMYQCIHTNPVEMAVCNYFDIFEDGKTEENPENTEQGMWSTADYMKGYAKDFHTLYYGVLWNKIYITDIIKKQKILFNPEICLGEDSLFNLQYLRYVSNIYVTDETLYYHTRDNTTSLTNVLSAYDMWMMSVDRYRYCIGTYEYLGLLNECKSHLAYRILSDLMIPVDGIIDDPEKSLTEKKDMLKTVIENDIVDFGYKNAEKLSVSDKIIIATRKHYGLMVLCLKAKRIIKK